MRSYGVLAAANSSLSTPLQMLNCGMIAAGRHSFPSVVSNILFYVVYVLFLVSFGYNTLLPFGTTSLLPLDTTEISLNI